MPYTNDPAGSLSDRVRFYVGDTNTSSPDMTDEEVAFLLEDEGNDARRAAARAAEVLAAKYSATADEKQVGPLRLKMLTDKSAKYSKLAKQLWSRASIAAAGLPFAGGISQADKDSRAGDADRVNPSFARGMMDYPVGETSAAANGNELL